MGARAVGGTVVKVALGAAAGVALMLLLDGRRGTNGRGEETAARARENSGHARAPADDPVRLEPASASSPALHKGDEVAAVVERDPDAKPIDPTDDELARLRMQVTELEAEIARLRAQLADGSPRRHALHGLIAANELRYGKLYEEIVGLVVDDPESVAEDPRHAFDLILQLIDETGLAGAKLENGIRQIQPEPAAPDVRLSLSHGMFEENEGAPAILRRFDQVEFHATLQLEKVPEGWLGQPLAGEVELSIQESDSTPAWVILRLSSDSHDSAHEVRWNLNVNRDGAYLTRFPVRGAEDSRETSIADLAKERGWLDRVFQQLMTRAR
jgi:hypothetical protein